MPERPEADGASGPVWDETVDVLCVGTGPGVLAYAVHCAAADLDVLIIESELDPQTAQWRDAMLEDLDPAPADPRLNLFRAEPITRERITDRTRLEPFVGGELRRWSELCLASPFGVMFSDVPDLDPMRTADGRSVTVGLAGEFRCAAGPAGPALTKWLREQAEGLFAPAGDRIDGLLTEDGRIAGVALATDDGPRRIGAARGLALALGPVPDEWPEQPALDGLTAEVAIVGRTAGRFAKVELRAR